MFFMRYAQKKNYQGLILVLGIVIVFVAVVVWITAQNNQPDKLDAFAACLKDKGAVFYGAFWCPHCQNQKALFGRSERLLPYVECSTPDGRGQLEVCREKNVEGYPTWVFPDGSRESGEIALDHLAEKTGCELPAE